MTINSEHMTERDCTREDVRTQARWELDRAADIGGGRMIEWAARWGRALLTAADNAADQDELTEATEAANEAERALEKARDAVSQAVFALERLTERDDVSDMHSNMIGDVLRDLENGMPSR